MAPPFTTFSKEHQKLNKEIARWAPPKPPDNDPKLRNAPALSDARCGNCRSFDTKLGVTWRGGGYCYKFRRDTEEKKLCSGYEPNV